jgi:7-cyano-7-deazaguanine synthase
MSKAVVLLSGGLDSTTTLACAIRDGFEPIALTFRYGQRHSREIDAAKAVAGHYELRDHLIMDIDLSAFHTSALTSNEVEVPERGTAADIGDDIPVTYVPARNIILLSIAAGLCETEGAERIYIGANAVDYSGYPDCRPDFFEAYQRMLEVGTKTGVEGHPISIVTPIIDLTKADIVRLGKELHAPLHLTWSCYKGGRKACGRCDSCLLRLKGFEEAGYMDEIEYEALE